MKNFDELQKKLGVDFEDKELLEQAFCHRSYINEHSESELQHNERLEFLGDAVLELIVTEYLYHAYPDKPEGGLTNLRAALVNTKTLGKTAKEIGFNDFLLLSKGERAGGEKSRLSILCDTFEGFLGALYLDQGYDKAKKFIEDHLLHKTERILKQGLYLDAKSSFQEKSQEKMGITPDYRVLDEWGPDHAKHFLSGVFLGDELVAKGKGSSKQEAEEAAAKSALELDSPFADVARLSK